MGLFDRVKTSAAGIGSSICKGVGQIAGKATIEAKESAKIVAVKADIAALDADIESGYVTIGKAYVAACLAGKDVTDIGCIDTLKMMEPKLEKKIALEQELATLERELADSQVMQERQLVQAEVDEIKAKLDKAKALGAITDADYAERLAKANRKLEKFNEIRMLRKQKDLGLLNSAEYESKVAALLD